MHAILFRDHNIFLRAVDKRRRRFRKSKDFQNHTINLLHFEFKSPFFLCRIKSIGTELNFWLDRQECVPRMIN